MGSLNKALVIGRLGRDPEVRYTQGGSAVANFSIATDERWKGKNGEQEQRTEWHRIVAWGRQAELAGEFLSKGRQVYIEGRLQTREWEDRDGQKRRTTEIVATNIQFLDKGTGGGGGGGGMGGGGGNGGGGGAPTNDGGPPADDDIPF